ncbi:cellobiose dehydrogenase [Fusarium pseudocircinatum]|uniref:Cellobiose dehydrogenase n=1 Tax=Fusarium pseudocircinatum TaxID=56676 RepID=A0A8H5USF5_9HYPO|nr:cellobiose dehydrogenase [Fusarium pseudocircinatum]
MLPTVLLSFIPLVAGAAQYCQFEDSHHPLTLCAAVNIHANSTASSADWIITFGYQRVQDAGWVALGIGSGMYGALMFVTYANKSSRDLILNVRRGLGYYEPEPISTEPQVVTNAISINESGWFEVTFTCYRCSAWSSVTSDGSPQPWIWAANVNQVFTEASADSSMEKHGIYGHFNLDISEARGDDSILPQIDFTAENAAPNTPGAGGMGMLVNPHVVLGLVITIAVPLQVALGYVHHSRYQAGIKTPKATASHRWIGRLVIVGGSINALIGIQMAGERTILILFTLTLSVIDVVSLVIAARAKGMKNKEINAKSVGQDEDSRPFLGTNGE